MTNTHLPTARGERQLLLGSEPQTPSVTVSYDGTTTTSESATAASAADAGGSGRLFLSLLVDSIPVISSYALQNSIQTSSILVVGRLGPDELSAAAFSLISHYSLLDCAGWCVALGGTTALDTLGSQAFTGGQRRTDVSIHLQRCIFLLWILFLPVALVWVYAHPVLLIFGQAERLSCDVQAFLRILIIGAPGYIAFESLKKYLQCQGIMRASTVVLIAVLPVNVLLNILLVHHTPLGFFGSPLALSISYWLAFFLLVILTIMSPTHRRNGTWGGLDLVTVLDFRSCFEFLKLAIPGILMVGTEWAAFEIVALAAGRLGALPLAAQSIIMTADQILNTIPFGIGVAASTRVGNYIGSRSAVAAKHASHMSALLSIFVGAIVMVTLIATKNSFGYLFSDDAEVVQLVSKVMPLVASFQIADGLAGSCGGVLRGQGRQHLGALFNLVAYYVLALPMGITLAFHTRTHMGLQGLWIGQVVALFIVGFGEYAVVWLGTNWDKEIQKGKDPGFALF
ncbi:uncharacterized protein PHACADRAFT_163546 [Phanerochaete carnosa HHB-10118-sp]|uniref:Polysaccharide biosynthesis protein C-terminal domain-containing protein n=1 Tax=Phanerochaete carnosa (strain HHB-10118-sp) TaxID=650164 RepID=K5W2W2_PHACS|nr:uncharacterized protein PHACADRAFT_163546 [Phanerochaete carnosa HHB-10118-sp]EKM53264.1 hypothetical protein PHACADRAFT_163546 [Phanerochaete carnosa HHB-10118-sp]